MQLGLPCVASVGAAAPFLCCISSGAPPAEICHGVHRISQCLQVSCAVESQGDERGGLSAGSRRVKSEAVGVLRLGWLCHERLQRTSGRSTEGGASVSCLRTVALGAWRCAAEQLRGSKPLTLANELRWRQWVSAALFSDGISRCFGRGGSRPLIPA